MSFRGVAVVKITSFKIRFCIIITCRSSIIWCQNDLPNCVCSCSQMSRYLFIEDYRDWFIFGTLFYVLVVFLILHFACTVTPLVDNIQDIEKGILCCNVLAKRWIKPYYDVEFAGFPFLVKFRCGNASRLELDVFTKSGKNSNR